MDRITEGHSHHGHDMEESIEKANVILQLENLLSHPWIKEAVDRGELNVQGWYYDIGEGNVERYDELTESFQESAKFFHLLL